MEYPRYQKKQMERKLAVSLGFFFCLIFCWLSIVAQLLESNAPDDLQWGDCVGKRGEVLFDVMYTFIICHVFRLTSDISNIKARIGKSKWIRNSCKWFLQCSIWRSKIHNTCYLRNMLEICNHKPSSKKLFSWLAQLIESLRKALLALDVLWERVSLPVS